MHDQPVHKGKQFLGPSLRLGVTSRVGSPKLFANSALEQTQLVESVFRHPPHGGDPLLKSTIRNTVPPSHVAKLGAGRALRDIFRQVGRLAGISPQEGFPRSDADLGFSVLPPGPLNAPDVFHILGASKLARLVTISLGFFHVFALQSATALDLVERPETTFHTGRVVPLIIARAGRTTDPQAAMLNDTPAARSFACASLSISFGLDKPSSNTHP